MSPEEIQVRSRYLFLLCSQAIEQVAGRLTTMAPSPIARPLLDRSIKKELALLFRYWATRQIWERLESSEPDAKNLNLAVLRLFFEGFRLPKDGSGMRYAELSTAGEEIRELSRRITTALGGEQPALLKELDGAVLSWRRVVVKYTADALTLPLEELASRMKAWAES